MNTRRYKLLALALATALSAWIAACGGGQSNGAPPAPTILMQTNQPKANQLSSAAPTLQRVGIGIGGLSYYDRSFAMADVGRQSQVRGLDWSYDAAADANGNPGKDFQMIYSYANIGAAQYSVL